MLEQVGCKREAKAWVTFGVVFGCIIPIPRSEHEAVRLRDEGTLVKSWFLERGLGIEREHRVRPQIIPSSVPFESQI